MTGFGFRLDDGKPEVIGSSVVLVPRNVLSVGAIDDGSGRRKISNTCGEQRIDDAVEAGTKSSTSQGLVMIGAGGEPAG
jgi:hypothetical protein